MTVVDKYYLVFMVALFMLVGSATGVCAGISGVMVGVQYLDFDTVIEEEGYFRDGTIYIQETLTIENHGKIESAIHVNDGRVLLIENSGEYNAEATLGVGSKIIQVIKTEDNIRKLNGIVANYDIQVTNQIGVLNWDNIVAIADVGTTFNLVDAKIRMDTITSVDNVVINGDVFIYTNTIPISGTQLFSNVEDNGMVYVVPDNLDKLYKMETYKDGANNMFVRMIRSTDYARIFDNNMGRFLNLLNEKSPNDKLIRRMNSGQTIGKLNSIMSKSVKLHPIKLMQPLQMLYSHKMLENVHIDNDSGMGLSLFGVFSNDMNLMGVGPNINVKYADDLYMKIYGEVTRLEYSDDINEYNGTSYGVGTDVIYKLPLNNFVRAYGGFHYSSFDAGLVFDNSHATKNPDGYSGFIISEFGHHFDLEDNFYVSPFVMVGGEYMNVLNSDDSNSYVGAGGDIGFCSEFDRLRYDYRVRGIVRSDGGIGAQLNVSAWSIFDAAGLDFRTSAFYDKIFGLSYGVSLNAKFNF